MIDFDDLGDAEVARDEEEAPLRAAQEAEAVAAEEAQHFTARVTTRAQLRSRPDEDADCAGERAEGDVLRLVRTSGAWALLHPLELARIAADYQDYWTAILKSEVPRSDDAWIHRDCLVQLRPGKPPPEPPQEQGSLEPDTALTLVISTSASDRHCDVGLTLQVLRSLQANAALRGCRKLLVFDALPHEGESAEAESGRHWVQHANERLAEGYERYKRRLAEAQEQGDPAMHRVELLFMPHWGHLVGTVRYALERLSTPFVLLHQHDLLLSANCTPGRVCGILRAPRDYELFPLPRSLSTALARGSANYVILNRDVNFAGRSTQYFQAAPDRPDLWRVFAREHALQLDDEGSTTLTPFIGFSDQTHFARASWVRERVLHLVGERKCCMEFAVHELMLLSWLHDPMQWERTYMLGGMDDGPFIQDSQKNGHCWASEDDAYNEEKLDEVFVRPQDRVRHPTRPGVYLSLYIFQPGDERVPGRFDHFPDTDGERNELSRQLFDLQGHLQSRDSRKPLFVHRWAPS